MTSASPPHPLAVADEAQDHPRAVVLLLNIGHALDHLFLLIFATAVGTIAAEFGFSRWEDLMPYGVGAFFLFGLGSLPSGRLGDLWGRRQMMLVFFFGLGAAALLTALARGPWQLAGGLTLIGLFASIYHPVGIPMLVQRAKRPGAVIGVNGLAGNLGVAGRGAADRPSGPVLGLARGLRRSRAGLDRMRNRLRHAVRPQGPAPARKPKASHLALPPELLARALVVMTAAAITGSLLFNFTTNGNTQLLSERFRGLIDDPATIGVLLAIIYTLASVAQVVVGRLIDRISLKKLYLALVLAQIPWLVLAAQPAAGGFSSPLLGTMVCIFGAIPFTDAMIVRYVDDSVRSRVAGMRLTVSLGVSSLAVWLLGPVGQDVELRDAVPGHGRDRGDHGDGRPAVARRPDDEARAGCRDLSGPAQRAARRVDCPRERSRGE